MQPNERRTYRHHFGRLRSPTDTPRQTTGRILSARAPPRASTSRPCTRSAKTGQPQASSRHRHRGPSPTIHFHLRQPRACIELLSTLDSRAGAGPLLGRCGEHHPTDLTPAEFYPADPPLLKLRPVQPRAPTRRQLAPPHHQRAQPPPSRRPAPVAA
jgi:hypothetical protein